MSKGRVVKREKIKLPKDKLELPKGVKIKPLEVTVSLICERETHFFIALEGPLIQERRLTGLGDLRYISGRYEEMVRKLRNGNYSLHPTFEVDISVNY